MTAAAMCVHTANISKLADVLNQLLRDADGFLYDLYTDRISGIRLQHPQTARSNMQQLVVRQHGRYA